MKKVIFYEIARKLKSDPALFRKVKLFAALGFAGFLIVAGLTVWAGISAVRYLGGVAQDAALLPAAKEQVENVKSGLRKIQFQPASCWSKAQSLFAVQPWLEKPAPEIFRNLKAACLESGPRTCEGKGCVPSVERINTASSLSH